MSQEKNYWCGPATIQNALSIHGKFASELEISRKTEALEGNVGWDDQDGTDAIRQITEVLNDYLDAGYVTAITDVDPLSPAQKSKFWRDIVSSIDAGYGVAVNIVAPPNNYPKGKLGSPNPTYGGGTVFHYFLVVGYQEVDGVLYVKIADSGFWPWTYWISFDQLATLVTPKGYSYVPGESAGMDAQTLSDVMGGTVTLQRYTELLPYYLQALERAGCNTVERAAMFAAQIGHESVGLKYFEEIWGPTADQRTYDGRMGNGPGEGYKYRGRGPIQITGKDNYRNLSQWAFQKRYINSPTLFVEKPDLLSSPEYGFLGAVWYWTAARDMNSYADRKDINGATFAVNGGYNGLDDRKRRYQLALSLGNALLPGDILLSAKDDIIGFIKAYVGPIISDVKDIREQMTGGRDLIRDEQGRIDLARSYPGWLLLGKRPDGTNRTLVDAVGYSVEQIDKINERLNKLEAK